MSLGDDDGGQSQLRNRFVGIDFLREFVSGPSELRDFILIKLFVLGFRHAISIIENVLGEMSVVISPLA